MKDWWESLVQIRRSDGLKGTGLFISPSEILTAAHVVSRMGEPLAADELVVDIRYKQKLAVLRQIAMLPAWTSLGMTGSDFSLLKVEEEPSLGVEPVFEVPEPGTHDEMAAVGFVAQTDELVAPNGEIECKLTQAGERLLFAHGLVPRPGMSGGPLCIAIDDEVRVAGILTRDSQPDLIGLSVAGSLLNELRAALA